MFTFVYKCDKITMPAKYIPTPTPAKKILFLGGFNMENKEKNQNLEALQRIRSELLDYFYGTKKDEETGEALSLYDYFDDVLDYDFVINSNKEYKAVRVAITLGGPNIYINTFTKKLELYWWTEQAELPIDGNLCEEIDQIFEDIYNMYNM